MKMWSDSLLRNDLVKVLFLISAILGLALLFFFNPALSTPTFLAVITSLIFSPLVRLLEKNGVNRMMAILIVFATVGVALFITVIWTLQSLNIEWNSLSQKIPSYYATIVEKLKIQENRIKEQYPLLAVANLSSALINWAENSALWFAKNGPALMGEILTWMFIAPLVTFFMLKDGREVRKWLFQLIPNRFFETSYMVIHQISASLADYMRAKLLEAFAMAGMVTIGLIIVGSPYAIVLGLVAGVTNIIPYIGPIIGAVPGLLIAFFDPNLTLQLGHQGLLWPVLTVYLIANLIDGVFIFPIMVAKLVDLHPLLLIAVVAVGQQYYGLVGMLISIPVASVMKVIAQTLYTAVYLKPRRRGQETFTRSPIQ